MAVYGTSVTYKPADADSTTITAALGPEGDTELDDGSGVVMHRKARTATIQTDSSDATYSGIANPQINDVVSISSVDWRVANVGNELGGLVTLTLEKRPAHRVGRPGFRS